VRASAKPLGSVSSANPHTLRHACGYKLANDGKDTGLCKPIWGARISVRYTELAPNRFKDFWRG